METALLPREKVIKNGAANFQRGIEQVGGNLFLTNQRLIFESHAFNIQVGATIIPIEEITEVVPCWTKFLGIIPIVPNSLAVNTTHGVECRIVLSGRNKWKLAIESVRAQCENTKRSRNDSLEEN